MLGGCILSAAYTMTAEVYKKLRVNTDSGQIKYNWVLNSSIGNNGIIDCAIMAFPTTTFRSQAVNQQFGADYKELAYFRLTSQENIGRNLKITNVRQKTNGQLLFQEVELQNSPATWFNCNGSVPQIDPFGNVLQYNTTIHRAEVQGNG